MANTKIPKITDNKSPQPQDQRKWKLLLVGIKLRFFGSSPLCILWFLN